MNNFEKIINDAWLNKDQINQNSDKSIVDAVNQIIEELDEQELRTSKG